MTYLLRKYYTETLIDDYYDELENKRIEAEKEWEAENERVNSLMEIYNEMKSYARNSPEYIELYELYSDFHKDIYGVRP